VAAGAGAFLARANLTGFFLLTAGLLQLQVLRLWAARATESVTGAPTASINAITAIEPATFLFINYPLSSSAAGSFCMEYMRRRRQRIREMIFATSGVALEK
jgi:hypothetical protein